MAGRDTEPADDARSRHRADTRVGRALSPQEVRRLSAVSQRRARRGPPPLARDAAALARVLRRGRPAAVAVALAALAYLVAPADAVPDLVPSVGLLDDGAVLAAAVAAVRRMTGR